MELPIPVLIARAYALNWGSADGAQIHTLAVKRSSHESCTASPTDALDGESNGVRCGQRVVGKLADKRLFFATPWYAGWVSSGTERVRPATCLEM